jgi:hypothetical protein
MCDEHSKTGDPAVGSTRLVGLLREEWRIADSNQKSFGPRTRAQDWYGGKKNVLEDIAKAIGVSIIADEKPPGRRRRLARPRPPKNRA